MISTSDDTPLVQRRALRKTLLEQRGKFMTEAAAIDAGAALARHLIAVLLELEPEVLGAYWPYRSEFNAVLALDSDSTLSKLPIALPFAQRATSDTPARMHFRMWDRATPTLVDGVGLPASDGKPVVPDVLLVPCVGFTESGYRLGYGGGFFDRYLAEHPDVTTIGVAWAFSRIDEEALQPQRHDLPMTLIVTEHGAV